MRLLTKRNIISFIFTILLGLTPILWFLGKGKEVLLNGVDTNFPLDPASWIYRRLFVWDSVSNGGGDFSSGIPGLFFHFIQFLPFSLGFNLQTVQIFSLIFWFSVIVLSAYLFSRKVFPKSSIIQLLFVVFYSFNIYLFNTWENVKVTNLSLIASLPLGLAILMYIKDKSIGYLRFSLFTAFLGILLSGTGINPAYFAVFFISIFIFFLSNVLSDFSTNVAKERAKELGLFTLVIILVNSFWILPLGTYISTSISSSGSLGQIGFTDWVDSLSVHTGMLNVFRQLGAWDWYTTNEITGQPVYIPYSVNYFNNLPFIVFSFLLPALAILGLIFRDKDKQNVYLSMGLMLALGIFLGAGTHEPTGQIFKLLSNHVPFFSLFRSPWYIFTPLVVISTATLICLLFYSFLTNYGMVTRKRVVIYLSIFVLLIGNLLYSYPLVTGKVFRPSRSDSFYVTFPDYLFETKEWLRSHTGGRIIGYPDDQLERFKWGYTGVDSILSLFSQTEVMNPSLNKSNVSISKIIAGFYERLYKEEIKSAKNLAFKLGVDTLFEKQDQFVLPTPKNTLLSSNSITQIGKWRFHSLFENIKTPKILTSSEIYYGYPYSDGEELLPLLDRHSVLLNPEDEVVNNIPSIDLIKRNVVLSTNSQLKDLNETLKDNLVWGVHLKPRDPSKVEYRFEIPQEGRYSPLIERYKLEEFGIPLAGSLKVLLDNNEIKWDISSVDDSYIYLNPQNFTNGEHSVIISLQSNNLINEKNFKIDDKDRATVNSIEDKIEGNYLNIFNRTDHDISMIFNIKNFDTLSNYIVQVKYKHIFGRSPAVLVTQNSDIPIKSEIWDLPNHPEWNDYTFYYQPIKTPSDLGVLLLAKQTGEYLGTRVLYKDLKVSKVFSNKMVLRQEGSTGNLSNPSISFEKKSPVLYEGKVTNGSKPYILIFSENYSPDWSLEAYDSFGKKLYSNPLHFSANLYANAWYVDGMPEEYTFKIYYTRQNLLLIGAVISFATLIVIIVLNIVNKIRRKL